MTDDTDLSELLIQRHDVALTVANALEELHESTIAEVDARVGAAPELAALASLIEQTGGRVNAWKQSFEGLPGRWWDGMPTNPSGRDTYVAGVWAYVCDVEGRFGLGTHVQMHNRLSGLAGADFRDGIEHLPTGDTSAWGSRGIIRWSRPCGSDGVAKLVDACVDQVGRYLGFARRLTAEVVEHRGPTPTGSGLDDE